MLVRPSTRLHECSFQVSFDVSLFVCLNRVHSVMVVIIRRCSDGLHCQLVRRVAQLLVITAALGVLLFFRGFVAGILLLLMRRLLGQTPFEISSLLAAAVLGALVLLVKVSEDLIELCLHFLNLNVIIFLCRAVFPINFIIISRLHGHILSVFCQKLLFPLLL